MISCPTTHRLAGWAKTILALSILPTARADLFVTSQTGAVPNSVQRYDSNTGRYLGLAAAGEGLLGPLGLEFGPDGDLYVASANNNRVLRYDGSTMAPKGVFASGNGLDQPNDLAFGSDGNLYVCSRYNEVLRFDGQTGAFIDAFVSDTRLSYPRCLQFGPDGNLYVASWNTASVLRFDGSTGAFIDTFVSARSGGLATAHRLTFGPDGNLYVTVGPFPDHRGVLRYDGTTGEFIDQFAAVPFPTRMSAVDLTFGPDANLYVVTQGGAFSVLRFSGRTGEFLDYFVPDTVTAGGVLGNPYALAFSPDNPPFVECPQPGTVECGGEVEITASVFDLDGDLMTALWMVNGVAMQTNNVPASQPPLTSTVSLLLNLPSDTTNLVELWVADVSNHVSSCSTVVVVEDTTPPQIVSASATPHVLWPPNHKWVEVTVSAEVFDNCTATEWCIVSVESSEAQTGPGKRHGPPDWIITGPDTVALRAERTGRGDGPFYSIFIQAMDEAGNLSEPAVVTVTAPKSMGELRRWATVNRRVVPHRTR